MVLEQVLPQGDLGGELGRAEVAADGVLGVRVHKADVVLQTRDVGVVLMEIDKRTVSSTNGVDIVDCDTKIVLHYNICLNFCLECTSKISFIVYTLFVFPLSRDFLFCFRLEAPVINRAAH